MSNLTTHNIVIDSINRNWTIESQRTFNYSFRLTDNNNDLGILRKVYKNIKSFYIDNLIIPNFYIDIGEVHCFKDQILNYKNGDFPMHHVIFPKLSDLKYILVNIQEIGSLNEGTNNSINKSSAVMILTNVLLKTNSHSTSLNYALESDNRVRMYRNGNHNNMGESIVDNAMTDLIYFKNISNDKKIFTNPISTLNNLSISFYKPDGEEIRLLNDFLTIKQVKSTYFEIKSSDINDNTDGVITFTTGSDKLRTGLLISGDNVKSNSFIMSMTDTNKITVNNTDIPSVDYIFYSNKIEIVCTKFFSSEEYKLGDIIHFRNVQLDDSFSKKSELSGFLERKKGHVIVGLNKSYPSSSTFYNTIEILYDININPDTGDENINKFNLLNENEVSCNGHIINRDNQHLLNLVIETENENN